MSLLATPDSLRNREANTSDNHRPGEIPFPKSVRIVCERLPPPVINDDFKSWGGGLTFGNHRVWRSDAKVEIEDENTHTMIVQPPCPSSH